MSWWGVALVATAAAVLSTAGGWAITAGVLRLAARSSDAGRDDDPTGPRARSVLRGGTWIGLLERLAVTGSLLAGYPAGIAFVVAVKGLGRYPELREHPGSSERFVIGTLASLLWAAAIGALGRAIIAG